jgi:hypothetical protein
MNKQEKTLIKKAREDMDENIVSNASFRIQTILEELFQKGIEVGETIGYTKAIVEHADNSELETKNSKPKKGSK